MLTKAFWKGLGERALKTFVQTFIASMVAAVGVATTAWEVPWQDAAFAALGVALLATFLSVATSLGNASFVEGTPPTEIVVVEKEPNDVR